MFWEGVTYMMQRVELDGDMPLFPVARAFAFAPVLFGISFLDPPRGTRLARAMWHLGIVCSFFMRQALRVPSATIANDHGGLESRTRAPRSENGISKSQDANRNAVNE